jgi:hypothetical protein
VSGNLCRFCWWNVDGRRAFNKPLSFSPKMTNVRTNYPNGFRILHIVVVCLVFPSCYFQSFFNFLFLGTGPFPLECGTLFQNFPNPWNIQSVWIITIYINSFSSFHWFVPTI